MAPCEPPWGAAAPSAGCPSPRPRRGRGGGPAAVWLALIGLAGAASAQWSDGFEGYPDGSVLEGQGGWQGWDGVLHTESLVTSNLASEGAQSVRVGPGADTVRPFTEFTGGKWTLTVEQYLPSWFVGRSYFLVLNEYADGGPYQWSAQLGFDGDRLEVVCDCGGGSAGTLPLVFDQWTEIRLDIDLDLDTAEVFYGGQLLASYPWSSGAFGGSQFPTLSIAAIDLYPDVFNFPHTSEVYYDDFRIEPYFGPVGTAYCFGDGTGAPCPCGNLGATGEGCANSTGGGARLSALGSASLTQDVLTFNASGLLAGQPALLFAGDNAVNQGQGVPFGDGLRCAGGNLLRLGVDAADAAGTGAWGPGLAAGAPWTAGDVRRFQAWYRDPQGGPCGNVFNLSSALEITFTP